MTHKATFNSLENSHTISPSDTLEKKRYSNKNFPKVLLASKPKCPEQVNDLLKSLIKSKRIVNYFNDDLIVKNNIKKDASSQGILPTKLKKTKSMFKNVMLIDDNKIDLFVNQRIIEKFNPTVNTRVFKNAYSAISFFKLLEMNNKIKSLAIPDVILLDINMPEMNGFNFFKEFKELDLIHKNKIEVYMLSSSVCPDDIHKAQNETYCSGYITKPLTFAKLESILNTSICMAQDQQFKKII